MSLMECIFPILKMLLFWAMDPFMTHLNHMYSDLFVKDLSIRLYKLFYGVDLAVHVILYFIILSIPSLHGWNIADTA